MPDQTFLGWPFFETRHRELCEHLEAWCVAELHPEHGRELGGDELDAHSRSLVAKLAAGGFLKFAAPDPSQPDAKIDLRSLCLIRETLARHDGLTDFAFAMQGLGSGAITLFGSPSQKAEYLPAVREGRAIAAFAISEAHAGSDVSAMTTEYRLDGDSYVLNGAKTLISNSAIADYFTLFAVNRGTSVPGVNPEKPVYSAFLVPANTSGLDRSRRIDAIAPHPLGELVLRDVKVPKTSLLGNEGDGLRIALGTLDVFRTTVGGAALGFARRALDEALLHSTTRVMYGKPQADLQLIQAKLANMATSVDAAALLVYRAAWTKDQGGARITKEASMAKLFATEEAQKVIDDAVQILGGLGVTRGSVVESLYREIRPLRIYEGASEVQLQVIARQLRTEFESRTTA